MKCKSCNDLGYILLQTDIVGKQNAIKCTSCDSRGYYDYVQKKYGKKKVSTCEDYTSLLAVQVIKNPSDVFWIESKSTLSEIQEFIQEQPKEIRAFALLK